MPLSVQGLCDIMRDRDFYSEEFYARPVLHIWDRSPASFASSSVSPMVLLSCDVVCGALHLTRFLRVLTSSWKWRQSSLLERA